MSSGRSTVLVVLVALLGIAVAAGVTWATSRLVSQHIGLTSEPLTAGRRLLPATGTRAPKPSPASPAGTSSTARPPKPVPSTAASTPTSRSPETTREPPSAAPRPAPGVGEGSDSAPSAAPSRSAGEDSGAHPDD
jgi:hypothetical protein